ncbi:hypothetical protein AAG747_08805 [Rapidithrix thailandica]|uniref:Alpha-L-rhamnosidase six-hairpin glycosidase domain-containing protein n=1 Tax=Rapidithrix thailandica TaxID=413964 RepID=A0AAW9RSW0_9BACT
MKSLFKNPLWILLLCFACTSPEEEKLKEKEPDKESKTLRFTSSNARLEKSFDWARKTALSYVGASTDPVGPWYEAALPQREAFCMRDVAHQTIGAEILGLGVQNQNMLHKFAKNISQSKDWCSFWEINRQDQPAPADYRNDREFWYNLNANFDVVQACWRTYLWTGNQTYLENAGFLYFYEKSLDEYAAHWKLLPEEIMERPRYMHTPEPFDTHDNFHTCRGLPSYVENFREMTCSADLLASLYQGYRSYAQLLTHRGENQRSQEYLTKAESYRALLEERWWDETRQRYHTFWTENGDFAQGEGETMILWFGIAQDPSRIRATLNNLFARDWNVENISHFPALLSRYGYFPKALEYIYYLTDPSTPRREYPEVSFGVMEGVVAGLMGIEPYAPENRVVTRPGLSSETESEWMRIENLPVLNTYISVKHHNQQRTSFKNLGEKSLQWKAVFPGTSETLEINGKAVGTMTETDPLGNPYVYAIVTVQPGEEAVAEAK